MSNPHSAPDKSLIDARYEDFMACFKRELARVSRPWEAACMVLDFDHDSGMIAVGEPDLFLFTRGQEPDYGVLDEYHFAAAACRYVELGAEGKDFTESVFIIHYSKVTAKVYAKVLFDEKAADFAIDPDNWWTIADALNPFTEGETSTPRSEPAW